ncbi:MAG: undecaprenyl/decaprenyl-phosphate alpha-N-acetylglucosaminyl 1-phosphate transferase [Treponema sp.]|nr:undecaprenyl/decaprenyl-phosphate alpha-N-acetylglucosaminyl 1-phosphate transferase [Treponema sp.]
MNKIFIFVILSFLLSLGSMPVIIHFCNRHNIFDYQDSRKIHSGNISRLGGVGIALSFLISAAIYLVFNKQINLMDSLPILVAGFIIFLFALLDDLLTLPATAKLIVQLIAAGIVTFSGFRFTQIFNWHLPLIVSYVLTFGWIIGVINAYNLIDGLDGLCGTLSITAVTTLGVLFQLSQNHEAGLCFILAGSILGFLCFNWPPAKLFMGDDGSQFLGFLIATIPLYTSSGPSFEFNKFLIMIIITSFPVFDTIAAIWRRIRDHKPIMSPDRSHLHHKLLNLGYTGRQALYLIAFIQTLLCLVVILSSFIGNLRGSTVLFEALIFMVIFFSVIHYTNRAVNRKNKAAAEAVNQAPANPAAEEETKEPAPAEKTETTAEPEKKDN